MFTHYRLANHFYRNNKYNMHRLYSTQFQIYLFARRSGTFIPRNYNQIYFLKFVYHLLATNIKSLWRPIKPENVQQFY